MSTLEDITTEQRGLVGMVNRISQRFGSVNRRGFFVGAAVAGSAMATDPKAYALRPQTAYATICGPGNTAASGWTVFCCTINKGVNTCPPGSFAAGWWKAADSSWCGGGYRYIVDCNASCSRCSSGCGGDNICDKGCWSCSCGTGSSATCDQRRVCCNAFRYGQCNTHVKCSGGVHCRVVSCRPPYQWANCTTTSLRDDRTKEHSAPCVPQWSAIQQKYDAMGAQASFLKASEGPERAIGDGRGRYVLYQGGVIYWTASYGAAAMTEWVRSKYSEAGGTQGALGYPKADRESGLRHGGWLQVFERGAITDSTETSTQIVWGERWPIWLSAGRERGALGYPTAPKENTTGGGWVQTFQGGAITDSDATTPQIVWGERWPMWVAAGREDGALGYPTEPKKNLSDGWIQHFQGGAIVDSTTTTPQLVWGVMFQGWSDAGGQDGVLGYPLEPTAPTTRGRYQRFQGGELWALNGSTPRRVLGRVLDEWKAAGGADGRYGYPITDTVPTGGDRHTCTFEGGVITA